MVVDRSLLSRLVPSPHEREKKLAVFHKVQQILSPLKKPVILTGSVAKNTDLAGATDIDVFVLFEKDEPLSLEPIQSYFPHHTLAYADHPYLRVMIDGYRVDIVPAYRMNPGDTAKSAVDRSQLHTDFVVQHLKNPDDVRLLKHFLMQWGVYGAEARVMGFSGYLCELLVIHYGSFEGVLSAAAQWKPPIIIDIARHGTAYFFSEPLVVIDPVDKYRNAAAAVSHEAIATLSLAARKPTFTPRRKTRALRGSCIVYRFPSPPLVDDTLFPQLRKLERFVVSHFVAEGFSVIRSSSTREGDFCWLIVEVAQETLPSLEKVQGPAYYHGDGVSRFLSEYQAWIEGDRLVSVRKRQFRHARRFFAHLLTQEGVPKGIADAVRKGSFIRRVPAFYMSLLVYE